MIFTCTMHKRFTLLSFIGIIVTVCQAVKITNINVPATFTIDKHSNDTEILILDSDYDNFQNETGFVLTWLFNGMPIYQWIPNQKPYALSVMKGLVNLTCEASSDTYFKHKALCISKMSLNLTGEYTCHVQTFQSTDKRTAKLQVVVPERKLALKHHTDDGEVLSIICIVREIFPKPNVSIEFNDGNRYRKINTIDIQWHKDDDGLYTVEAERKVQISEMMCPTIIRCTLTLLETNYTRRAESIFYGEYLKN